MKVNYLKGLRVLLAILFILPITLYFVDFTNKLPDTLHALLHLQLVPAVLAGMWGIVIGLLLLTLLFGRIYCSVICPAGILQDIMSRFTGRGRKKNKYKRWFSFHKAANILRYSVLGVTVLSALLGSTSLLLLLDPYSNYGRIAANLLRPLIIEGNNVLADALASVDNYTLYHISIQHITVISFAVALVALLLFLVLSVLRGRLFCNTLCPVGALLSVVSRYSFFRITFDTEACNNCGNCERSCKSECINSETKTVDSSRCVTCFNCTSSCKKGGLRYRFTIPWSKNNIQEKSVSTAKSCLTEESVANSRRTFIATGATIAASLPLLPAWAKGKQGNKMAPITPPGSMDREHFSDKCTGCHLCVVKCPSQILRPAGLEFGLDYFLKPHVVYDTAYCNYECTLCSEVCPNKALTPLTKEEKATTQIGIAHFEKELCITYVDGTDCGACSEHCPTQAVRMVPINDSLRVPEVNPEICIGCGGCEYICPVRPARAIRIVANATHKKVERPEYEKVKDVAVDEFGF